MSEASFCLKCNKKAECKQICKELNSYLNKCQADLGYSDRHYKRKIRIYPPQLLEKIASQRAFELKYGKKWVERQQRKWKD